MCVPTSRKRSWYDMERVGVSEEVGCKRKKLVQGELERIRKAEEFAECLSRELSGEYRASSLADEWTNVAEMYEHFDSLNGGEYDMKEWETSESSFVAKAESLSKRRKVLQDELAGVMSDVKPAFVTALNGLKGDAEGGYKSLLDLLGSFERFEKMLSRLPSGFMDLTAKISSGYVYLPSQIQEIGGLIVEHHYALMTAFDESERQEFLDLTKVVEQKNRRAEHLKLRSIMLEMSDEVKGTIFRLTREHDSVVSEMVRVREEYLESEKVYWQRYIGGNRRQYLRDVFHMLDKRVMSLPSKIEYLWPS